MCVMYVNHDFLSQRKKKTIPNKKNTMHHLNPSHLKFKKKNWHQIYEQLKMLNHQFKANMHLHILWITLGEEN